MSQPTASHEIPERGQAASLDSALRVMAFILQVVKRSIEQVEHTKGFTSQRSRRVLRKVWQTIDYEVGADLLEKGILPTLLDPASLGISPHDAAQLYNGFVSRVLSRYPSLDARCNLVGLYQALCKLDGWSICENPRCAKMFELPGSGDCVCSRKCRKSMQNRCAWFRRKAQ